MFGQKIVTRKATSEQPQEGFKLGQPSDGLRSVSSNAAVKQGSGRGVERPVESNADKHHVRNAKPESVWRKKADPKRRAAPAA